MNENRYYWKEYWAHQSNPLHRFQTEEFYKKKAKEELFHLNGGESLLDFGCGSADSLAYIAKDYTTVVGADFSRSMLLKTRERLDNFNVQNVLLVQADDDTIWDSLSLSFDRMMSAGVVQYFNWAQLENFIFNSKKIIKSDGYIILFDIIDPRLYWSWNYGMRSGRINDVLKRIHGKNSRLFNNCSSFFLKAACLSLFHQMRSVMSRTPSSIGNPYDPMVIKTMAEKNGLEMEYVCSMYYEYRYHAILKNKI